MKIEVRKLYQLAGIHEIILILCAFFLPLQLRVVTYLLILLFFILIIQKIADFDFHYLRTVRLWIFIPFLFFSVFLIQSAYTQSNNIQVMKDVETKAPFLFLPLFFLLIPKLSFSTRSNFIRAFAIGNGLFVVLSILKASVNWIQDGNIGVFFYQKLSHPFHPTYLALYCCLSIGAVYYELVSTKRSLAYRILLIMSIGLFSLYVALLSSKAGFISFVLTLFIMLYFSWRRKLNMRIFFRTSLIAVVSFSLFYLSVDRINGRVSSAVTDFSDSHESTKKASTAMRFVTWRAAMKILKNNPYGIGVGNWRMAFKKEYLAMGELEAAEKPLPAHNAFLQIGVEWGYFGFFLLCFIVVLNIYYSFQSKSLFFWVFSILFPVNFLFESMLELQQGIVLFTFLTLILGFRNYSQGFPA